MWCRNARGLVSGSAGSQGPDGLRNSKGNPRNRHGEWALEGGHGQSLSTQTTNEAKQKQRFKATSEEENKSQQTPAQKKQKPTSD